MKSYLSEGEFFEVFSEFGLLWLVFDLVGVELQR